MTRTLRARWIAPMTTPVIEDGVVVINDGRIEAVGPRVTTPSCGQVEDLGDVVLLPGLINAHTHLELSDARPSPQRPASFGAWLTEIVTRRSTIAPTDFPKAIADAARRGAAECLSFGVTTVGDISRESPLTRPALRDGPLRVISFGEVQAAATRRGLLEERLAVAVDASHASAHLTIAVSPHAPYTVEPDAYRRCVQVARARGLRICTHLAESPEEAEYLAQQTGPIRTLWETLGTWDANVPRWNDGPIALAAAVGLLDIAPLLAHVNYANDAELDLLATTRAGVVFCPRTHAFFGHPPHRWRDMLARGINVCVGTDSRASSPDLNLVDDLRLLHRQAPDVDAHTLWQLVTMRAAQALRLDDVGALQPSARADMVAFPAGTEAPLRSVLENPAAPSGVWSNGRRLT